MAVRLPSPSKPEHPTHRANRFLAALASEDLAYLEPHLETVTLPKGTVLYETGDTLRHAYFPHDSIIALVAVMDDGRSAEMAVVGGEAKVGIIGAVATRQALGRYVVQFAGRASWIDLDRMHEVINARPAIRQLMLLLTEALMSRVLQNVACNALPDRNPNTRRHEPCARSQAGAARPSDGLACL